MQKSDSDREPNVIIKNVCRGFLGVEAQRGVPIDISLSLLVLNH